MSSTVQIFPEYQSNQTVKIRFQKYITLSQLFQDTISSKLQQFFPSNYEQQFSKYIFIFRVYHNHHHWNLKKTFAELHTFQHAIRKKHKNIPKFPLSKDDQVNLEPKILSPFVSFLHHFIKSVYENAIDDPLVSLFFDLFPQKLGHGIIYGEFPLHKRSGGRYNETSCLKSLYHYVFPCTRNWRRRFFTVTDNGIFYSEKSKSYDIKDIMLYCFKFKIYYGFFRTGKQLGIVLQSSIRRLKLQAQDFCTLILFIVAIQEAINNSFFCQQNRIKYQRYGSFAPIRRNCSSKLYIDGKGYFEDLFQEMKKAKKEVYITGWMITPYFMMKRPNELLNRQYRFDGILEDLAKKNVKIFIILYQQPKIAINNDSQFVKTYLEGLGKPNIKVVRHPNYIVIPFLWSHHQKLVIIDQKVAFLGGLDICYGRWDISSHPLKNPQNMTLWEGADFCNLRIRDVYKPRDYMMSNLAFTEPKMPWHDVAIQIRGTSVLDLSRHFTNYWNFVNFQTKIDNDRELLSLAGLHHPQMIQAVSKFAAIKQFFKNFHIKKSTRVQPMIELTKTDALGKQSEIKERMSARSLRSSYSSRRNSLIEEQFYDNYMKREEQNKQTNLSNIKDKIFKYHIKLWGMIKKSDEEQEKLIVSNQYCHKEADHRGKHTHLILRSSSTWSGGLSEPELSIHQAYLDLIKHSKKFIYIENQFFIAKENMVVDQLAKRIIKAHKEKQLFKVMVFIPLLPGFEGDVRESNSTVMRIQLHHEYQTICRSSDSLFSILFEENMSLADIENHIIFFSLRQHGIIADLPVTEILYIHSKLMIVDDQKMIIGSANINDRSLLGDRDSEIALLLQDHQLQTPKRMTEENKNYYSDIKSFRISLLKQHFAIGDSEAENFYEEQSWRELKIIAKKNTQIYRHVFGCYPDDKMKRFEDIGFLQKQTEPERAKRYQEQKKQIQGHAVLLPLHFLEEQNLEIQITEKEIILPDFFFT